jgi:gluconate 2-dehydrogenase gamma chain
MSSQLTRRDFSISALGLLSAAEIAPALQHAHQAVNSATPAKFEHLDAAAASDVEALTWQIIPSDGTPGAREAGVVYFIDRALGSFEADKLDAYRQGLAEVRAARQRLFPQAATIASLSAEQTQKLLMEIEKTDFFELLRRHTVLGFLGSPAHGGNRGGVGWAHIGFEDKMIFEPPFGYYDAEAMKEAKK